MDIKTALYQYTLRLADSNLIMGHRLSELCSKGPYLEEDIAISNIALDYLGQANALYSYASEQDKNKKSIDDLVFHRDPDSFFNLLITEQENGHFGDTITKIFYYSIFQKYLYTALLESQDQKLAAIAEKSLKEVEYHIRHSSSWVIRLGDGTQESNNKMQDAINKIWNFTDELFEMDEVESLLLENNIAVNLAKIKNDWKKAIDTYITEATLTTPKGSPSMVTGGKKGKHSENLALILSTMQHLPRKYPDAKW